MIRTETSCHRNRSGIASLAANWWTGLVLLAVVGCGGTGEDKWTRNRPSCIPASGQVLLDGQPVEAAVVIFQSTDGTISAQGVTDSQGRFTLSTFVPDDGAPAKTYFVACLKQVLDYDPSKLKIGESPPANALPKSVLPLRYENPAKSGLTAEVVDGDDNHFVFELKRS